MTPNIKKNKIPVVDPYTERVLGRIKRTTPQEVHKIITELSKRRVFVDRKKMGEILHDVARNLQKNKKYLSELMAKETGKVIKDGIVEVERTCQTLLLNSELKNRREEYVFDDSRFGRKRVRIERIPVGIVGAITPFNHPLNLVAHSVAPALMGGNSVILKPSEKSSISAIKFREIFVKSGLPPQIFALVTGYGQEAGIAVASHEKVNAVVFIGGIKGGRDIARAAAGKRMVLELSGNDALIIRKDADVDRAVEIALEGRFSNVGQRCTSTKRILVHNSLHSEFVEKFSARIKRLKVGNPLDDDTDIGPLIDITAAMHVESIIKKIVKEGADVVVGGRREGAFIYPALLDNVSYKSIVFSEEIFGPVASVIEFDKDDEAVRMSNATPYGLQAGILTKDYKKAVKIAGMLEVGGVVVGGPPGQRVEWMPFGGIKASGIGRMGVPYMYDELTVVKTVLLPEEGRR